MKYAYFITLLILASAILGSAQFSGSGISQSCQTTLLGLLGNQNISSCFPFQAILGLVSNGATPNDTTLSSAADAICADPACPDSLVNQTQSTVQSGCQQDLKNNVPIVGIVNAVLEFYDPTRTSLCFKNSTNGYCFIESETGIQQILQNSPANQNPILIFANASTQTVCTPCNKAIANTYFNYLNSNPNSISAVPNVTDSDVSTVKNALSGKCGSSFIDGTVGNSTENPQTFQSQLPTPSTKSDATSLIANNMGFVVLVGLILAML